MSPLLLLVALGAASPTLETLRVDAEAVTPSMEALLAEPAGSVSFLLSGDYGVRSWVTTDEGTITSRGVASGALGIHLGKGVRLDLHAPIVVTESGSSPLDSSPLTGFAVGSLRGRLRYGATVGELLSLGVAARLELGSLELGQSPAPSAGPELMVALRIRPIWIGLDAGADTAGRLDGRVGVALAVADRVWLTGELAASGPGAALATTSAGSGATAEPARIGLEARAALRVELSGGPKVLPALELGGGAGLIGAPGVPQARGWLGLRLRIRQKPKDHPVSIPSPVPEASPVAPTATSAPLPAAPPEAPPAPTVRLVPIAAEPATPSEPLTPSEPATPSDAATPSMKSASTEAASAPAVRPTQPSAFPQPLQLRIGFDGTTLTRDGLAQAWMLAAALTDRPGLQIRLEVHVAPRTGVDDFAESQARADAIVAALVARGVSPGRAEALGFGSGGYGEDIVAVVVVQHP